MSFSAQQTIKGRDAGVATRESARTLAAFGGCAGNGAAPVVFSARSSDMAKVKCKGTTLQHTVSAALATIAQVTSLEISGSASETFDSTTLDGSVYKTYDQTGYSEPGTVSAELFYDPALAGHQAITDLIAAPADNAMKVIYADTGTTEQTFTAAGVEFGVTVDMGDGLKGSVTYQIDGDPGWST